MGSDISLSKVTLPKDVFNKYVRRLSLEEFSQIEYILKVQLGLNGKQENNKKLTSKAKKPNIFVRFFNLFRKKNRH